MLIQTTPNPRWVLKFLLVSAALGGWGLWCGYDGLIHFPTHNQKIADHQKLGADPAAWQAHARANGWDTGPPEGVPYSDGQILSQWAMLAALGSVSLWLLVSVALRYRWPLQCDDESLSYTWGKRVKFTQIRKIDKSEWDNTGLALIEYDADGHAKYLRIDDYVFRGAANVLDQIERRTGLGDSLGD